MGEDCFFEKIEKAFSEVLPGVPLFLYENIGSTNDEAKEYALSQNGKKDAFFIARTQSAGRGRRGRSFLSEEGGLYMSYLLHPSLSSEESLKLTLFAAVCVTEAIEELTGITVGIKWVNDILCEGKKLSGILSEGAFDKGGRFFEYAVIGIGINVKKTHFPKELADIAGDIESFAGECPDISRLAAALAKKLSAFESADPVSYMSRYREKSIAIGRTAEVISAGGNYFAKILDIDCDGALVVKTERGEQKKLISGEISIKL